MSKFWEIAELEDGSFVLQSSDEDEAPLVRIEFSPQAESMLQGHASEIARVMIGAGVQAASFSDDESIDSLSSDNKVVH